MPEFCDPSGVGWTVPIAIRLLSGKPSACSASGPGTNTAPSLDGGSPALFEFPTHSPATSEPHRSSMARPSFRSSNPEGWQKVAGGHSAAARAENERRAIEAQWGTIGPWYGDLHWQQATNMMGKLKAGMKRN